VRSHAARGRIAVSPYLLPGVLPNMAAARVAIAHGIEGYSASIATACASGARAVAEALRLLRGGEADVVVCGCAEALLFDTFAETFTIARALARGWSAQSEAASRPFDRRRNGFVLSEGAAVFVVERRVFAAAPGVDGPPVSSVKGVTGHMLGASGAVDVAVGAAALGRGLIPPTHNLDQPGPACDLDHVLGAPRAGRVDRVLTNSFGFGGHNVSLVLGRAGTRRSR
jgi:3-oxoacyl-(acyl-carrier-protein) synthase